MVVLCYTFKVFESHNLAPRILSWFTFRVKLPLKHWKSSLNSNPLCSKLFRPFQNIFTTIDLYPFLIFSKSSTCPSPNHQTFNLARSPYPFHKRFIIRWGQSFHLLFIFYTRRTLPLLSFVCLLFWREWLYRVYLWNGNYLTQEVLCLNVNIYACMWQEKVYELVFFSWVIEQNRYLLGQQHWNASNRISLS